jgi:hypothetical protein
MTPAMQRILDEVQRDGQRIYNGRLRKQIIQLRDRGLVDAEMDLVLHGKGDATERWTVRMPFGSVC